MASRNSPNKFILLRKLDELSVTALSGKQPLRSAALPTHFDQMDTFRYYMMI